MLTAEKVSLVCLIILFFGYNLLDIKAIVKNQLYARIFSGSVIGVLVSIVIILLGCYSRQ